jgi:hypothetical protein
MNRGTRILHGIHLAHWSDSNCRRIPPPPHGRHDEGLLEPSLKEFILPDQSRPLVSAVWDNEMIGIPSSMERTRTTGASSWTQKGFETKNFRLSQGDGQEFVTAKLKD